MTRNIKEAIEELEFMLSIYGENATVDGHIEVFNKDGKWETIIHLNTDDMN